MAVRERAIDIVWRCGHICTRLTYRHAPAERRRVQVDLLSRLTLCNNSIRFNSVRSPLWQRPRERARGQFSARSRCRVTNGMQCNCSLPLLAYNLFIASPLALLLPHAGHIGAQTVTCFAGSRARAQRTYRWAKGSTCVRAGAPSCRAGEI